MPRANAIRLVALKEAFRSTNLTRIPSAVALAASFFVLSVSALAQTIPPAVKAAEASIDPEKIRAHVKFLSDDLLEGRGPGLRGSEIAAQYIATQFALYGLKPGGDNGTYLQQINMVGMNAIPDKTTMSIIPPKRPEGQIGIMLYSYRPQVRRRLHRLQPHPHPHRRHRRPHRLRRLRHHRARVQLERLRQHRRQRQSHPLHRRRPTLHRPQLLRRRRPHLLRPLDLQIRTSRTHGSRRRTHHPPHRPRQLRLGRRQKLQHQRKNLPPRQQRPAARSRKLDPARRSQTNLQILQPRRRRRDRSRRQTRLQSHRTPRPPPRPRRKRSPPLPIT